MAGDNSIFKKKDSSKHFAFVEDNATQLDPKEKNLDEFVSSGRGQTRKSLNPKGRPKLKEEELKKETVMIYLTKEQKKLLSEKAEKASLSVSKYILLKIFGID
ncbi:plasmid mobilization protein [Aliarcobacter butzleri]|uniref:plasmid mobilization protein n=1 Tax=Aliarcobacter butzleri TaxID=28197 RepID=UPI003AE197A5